MTSCAKQGYTEAEPEFDSAGNGEIADTTLQVNKEIDLKVYINDLPVAFATAKPILVEEKKVYLPFKQYLESAGGQLVLDTKSNKLIGNSEQQQNFVINMEKEWFKMPERDQQPLEQNVIVFEGIPYVSIDFIRTYLFADVAWLKADNEIFVYKIPCVTDTSCDVPAAC